MAGSLDLSLTIGKTSQQNLTIGETSNQNRTVNYDFSFTVKSARVLNIALKALSDETFNPGKNAVIQVGEEGFEIIVSTLNVNADIPDFGYFSLKATCMDKFEYSNPIEKSMSLSGIPSILKSSEKFIKRNSVSVYSVQSSNELSIEWGADDDDPHISTIQLEDVDITKEKFPNRVGCAMEAVVPSDILRKMSGKLHKSQPVPCSNAVELILQQLLSSGTVVTSSAEEQSSGNVVTSSAEEQSSGNVVTSSAEEQPKEQETWKEWPCWKSLKEASSITNKASLYLVTRPTTGIMVRFKLQKNGCLIYLIPATSNQNLKLPILNDFYRLIQFT